MAALATPWLLAVGVLAATSGVRGAAWPGDALQLLQSDVRLAASPAAADGSVPPIDGAAVQLASLAGDEEHPDIGKILKELQKKREREAAEEARSKTTPKPKAAPTAAPDASASPASKRAPKAKTAATTPEPKRRQSRRQRAASPSKSAGPTLAPRSHYKSSRAYQEAKRELDKLKFAEAQKKREEEERRRVEHARRDYAERRGWWPEDRVKNFEPPTATPTDKGEPGMRRRRGVTKKQPEEPKKSSAEPDGELSQASVEEFDPNTPSWKFPREKWSDWPFNPASAPLGNTTAPAGWGDPEPKVYAGPYSNEVVVGFEYKRRMRLLVFIAAGTRHRPMRMVKRNIQHIKSFENKSTNAVFDIYMAHYDTGSRIWRQDDGFYKRNVKYSADRYGLKFPLAKELLLKPKKMDPAVNITEYDWIWFLDEDADITRLDMRYLLKDLYDTGSLIVSPSIVPAVIPASARRLALAEERSSDREGEAYGCQPGTYDCTVQYPQTSCRFRYMNFVEVSFPLMRTDAFQAIFSTCATCMHKQSVWGLDHVWCKLAPHVTAIPGYDQKKACAVLDRASVVHRNFRTLQKWDFGNDHRKIDQLDFAEVKYHMPDFWVDEVVIDECVKPGPPIG